MSDTAIVYNDLKIAQLYCYDTTESTECNSCCRVWREVGHAMRIMRQLVPRLFLLDLACTLDDGGTDLKEMSMPLSARVSKRA